MFVFKMKKKKTLGASSPKKKVSKWMCVNLIKNIPGHISLQNYKNIYFAKN